MIRHAKSSWSDSSLADWERPLNQRGQRDAPEMAERLAASEADVELLVTSPAERARQTAQAFADVLRLDDDELAVEGRLYGADEEDWMDVVGSLPRYLESVAMVGHNPGLTEFVNMFLNEALHNIPTCGIARLQFEIDDWEQIYQAEQVHAVYSIPKRDGWEALD